MKYIKRNRSVVTGKANLEPLYTFKDFPVFFSSVDHPPEKDLKADMSWAICPETGVIQLNKLIPLDILYQEQHVDGTGPTWQKYYRDFAKYLKKQSSKNILEIGGGIGTLAEVFTKMTRGTTWTIVEPNPMRKSKGRIKVKAAFFDGKFKYRIKVDTVTFSQVLEHAYDPQVFIKSIAKFLKPGQKLVFAYPNLKLWLERYYTNAINFEHTMFLTDYHVDYLLAKHGFKILDKYTYKDHSIFYTAAKSASGGKKLELPKSKYQEYKKIFNNFVRYHEKLVTGLNKKIEKFDGEIYLFGAHIFAHYLFGFGLKQDKIKALLDNSPGKQGRRLYGTHFMVEDPKVLKNKKKPGVILKVGIYRDEIYKQLKKINPGVRIFE